MSAGISSAGEGRVGELGGMASPGAIGLRVQRA